MIISFAWTTQALLAGRKTVTRREWTDGHAAKFKPGDLVDAWDKLPRCKGSKKVAVIRIISIKRSLLSLMLGDLVWGIAEIKREGGMWASVDEFVALFTIPDPYRVEFELVSVRARVVKTELGADEPGEVRNSVVLSDFGDAVCFDRKVAVQIFEAFLTGDLVDFEIERAMERLSLDWVIKGVRQLESAA